MSNHVTHPLACLALLTGLSTAVGTPAVSAPVKAAARKQLTLDGFCRRLRDRLQGLRSLSGEASGNTFELMRPGRYHLRIGSREVWCDGKTRVVREGGKETARGRVTPDDRAGDLRSFVGLDAFFDARWRPYRPVGPNRARYQDRDCIRIELKFGESPMFWTRLYVDAKTWLPMGWDDYEMGQVNGGGVYSRLVVDPKLPASHFRPPSSGAERYSGEGRSS